eukprot:EW708094.1.p1 GENE.EW708094.1~~EW708094.1.p1  ORF type:complete len:71 (+),score=8.39 EW708094.1:27-239(+)
MPKEIHVRRRSGSIMPMIYGQEQEAKPMEESTLSAMPSQAAGYADLVPASNQTDFPPRRLSLSRVAPLYL